MSTNKIISQIESEQMEKELAASQKHLQELSRKSIEVLESDRRTTAKELHDGIGASLAAPTSSTVL